MRLLASHQLSTSNFSCAQVLYNFNKVLNSTVLLCVMVVDASCRKVLLPKEIAQSHLDTDSVQEFFDSELILMLSG